MPKIRALCRLLAVDKPTKANLQPWPGQNPRWCCPYKCPFLTAEGVTGQKRLPERDYMPTSLYPPTPAKAWGHIHACSPYNRSRHPVWSAHGPKTCSSRTHVDGDFLGYSFLMWLLRVGAVKNACMPDRGYNPTPSITSGRRHAAIHKASAGGQKSASVVHF